MPNEQVSLEKKLDYLDALEAGCNEEFCTMEQEDEIIDAIRSALIRGEELAKEMKKLKSIMKRAWDNDLIPTLIWERIRDFGEEGK